ncbi:hypothetical protein AOZ06_42665 [Kibdelosporangium phytohabitans]|uniref:Uncharacterized protein n=1 Tax=Kibdelosporangium phytohabitans TaxID=860235 RepID=A0A0N9I472_9PSEU|nr:hypothetical protein AOZ06_42665 [Kibdelosporangium phytohabitans]
MWTAGSAVFPVIESSSSHLVGAKQYNGDEKQPLDEIPGLVPIGLAKRSVVGSNHIVSWVGRPGGRDQDRVVELDRAGESAVEGRQHPQSVGAEGSGEAGALAGGGGLAVGAGGQQR